MKKPLIGIVLSFYLDRDLAHVDFSFFFDPLGTVVCSSFCLRLNVVKNVVRFLSKGRSHAHLSSSAQLSRPRVLLRGSG
jgi:hypothetical protein